ncbi:MAG: hypothetical protein MUO73_07715, partial [Thermoplasmata archaeon]|nr:hypothetical protein [Thermoplasmata archaeon]
LNDGGNGVPFDFSSVVGGFSDFVDRVDSYLAVFTVYVAAVVVFCVVFCVVDRAGHHWSF